MLLRAYEQYYNSIVLPASYLNELDLQMITEEDHYEVTEEEVKVYIHGVQQLEEAIVEMSEDKHIIDGIDRIWRQKLQEIQKIISQVCYSLTSWCSVVHLKQVWLSWSFCVDGSLFVLLYLPRHRFQSSNDHSCGSSPRSSMDSDEGSLWDVDVEFMLHCGSSILFDGFVGGQHCFGIHAASQSLYSWGDCGSLFDFWLFVCTKNSSGDDCLGWLDRPIICICLSVSRALRFCLFFLDDHCEWITDSTLSVHNEKIAPFIQSKVFFSFSESSIVAILLLDEFSLSFHRISWFDPLPIVFYVPLLLSLRFSTIQKGLEIYSQFNIVIELAKPFLTLFDAFRKRIPSSTFTVDYNQQYIEPIAQYIIQQHDNRKPFSLYSKIVENKTFVFWFIQWNDAFHRHRNIMRIISLVSHFILIESLLRYAECAAADSIDSTTSKAEEEWKESCWTWDS